MDVRNGLSHAGCDRTFFGAPEADSILFERSWLGQALHIRDDLVMAFYRIGAGHMA